MSVMEQGGGQPAALLPTLLLSSPGGLVDDVQPVGSRALTGLGRCAKISQFANQLATPETFCGFCQGIKAPPVKPQCVRMYDASLSALHRVNVYSHCT